MNHHMSTVVYSHALNPVLASWYENKQCLNISPLTKHHLYKVQITFE